MNTRGIFIDYLKCVGCGTCEMVCSLVHENASSPALSRIRIVRYRREALNVPITCAFCEKPPCLDVCPVGAITKNHQTGDVRIRSELCIGCRQCIQACPFGHMNFNPAKGVAFKCDLCGGDPQCVKFCWTGAIEYVDPEMAVDYKRSAFADSVMQQQDDRR